MDVIQEDHTLLKGTRTSGEVENIGTTLLTDISSHALYLCVRSSSLTQSVQIPFQFDERRKQDIHGIVTRVLHSDITRVRDDHA